VRALRSQHERFLASPAEAPRGLRSLVAESWLRSASSGVDPEAAAPLVLDEETLRAYRAGHPLAAVMPVIRRLLAEDAEDLGHVVAVADADGRLLWLDGFARLRSRAEGMHFVEGALWSEAAAGTNAPGTALALGHPVSIFAAEHFGVAVQPWSCVAAPIRAPGTGELLGVVDLTGTDEVASPQALALVRATAAAAEAELALRAQARTALTPPPRRQSRRRHRVDPADGLRLAVLGRESGLLVAGDRTLQLSRRHTELVLLLGRHPNGLSAEQLATALHPGAGALVTVRAEMSRLRRVLGADLVDSRPYRLTVPLTSDADDVRRALGRGALHKALDAYAGTVLPGSDSPEVQRLRDELVAEMREAVLTSRSGAALLAWAETEEGHDDMAVWEALLTVLPYGSPRRTTARAHLHRLAAEDSAPGNLAATSLQRRRH
jgi:transcriptional regulator of acetoin/glycerol metabolism